MPQYDRNTSTLSEKYAMEVDATKVSYIRMFRQYSANIHETRKQDYRNFGCSHE